MAIDLEKLKKRVKSDVRSVLISAPRGVLKRNFRREYMGLVGSDIPLSQLGYNSLDDFVYHNRDVVREGAGPTGEPTYFVVANAETQHVADLVSKQKKPSLSKLRKAAPKPNFKRPNFVPTHSRSRNAPPTTRRSSRMVHTRSFNTAISSTLKGKPIVRTMGNVPSWNRVLDSAKHFNSVKSLLDSKGTFNDQYVSVVGYPGSHRNITQYDGEFRLLLHNDYKHTLVLPFLNVFFTSVLWDTKVYRDPLSLPNEGGVKITVWGKLMYKYWKAKQNYVHSLKAMYYKRHDASSPAHSLRITVPGTVDKKPKKVVPEQHELCSNDTSSLNHSSPPSKCSTPGNSKELGKWVNKAFEDKDKGVWAKVLLSQYNKQFGAVPPDLLTNIVSLPCIEREDIVEDNPILHYIEPKKVSADLPLVKPKEAKESNVYSCESLEDWVNKVFEDRDKAMWGKVLVKMYAKQFGSAPPDLLASIVKLPYINADYVIQDNPCLRYVDHSKTPLPDTVTLPTDERDYIDALVVSISAPQEFYIQRHSEKFSSALQGLTDEMNEHFAQSSILPKKVHMDTVYGVCWEDGSWCRAVVLSIADSKVVVQFPDYGNKEIISADKLRVIPSSFLKLPFQAVCCSLHNVSATSEDAVQIFEDIAFEQCCLLEVIEKHGSLYSVILKLCEETADSVNNIINYKLNPLETLLPGLPVGKGRVPVSLVGVSDVPGDVYVHLLGLGTDRLSDLTDYITEYYKGASDRPLTKSRLTQGMVCCTKKDEKWYRVTVESLELGSSNKVSIRFMDYGTKAYIDPMLLRQPPDVALLRLPGQYLRCHLKGLPPHNDQELWSDEVTELLLEYYSNALDLEVDDNDCLLYDQDRCINNIIINTFYLQRTTPITDDSVSSTDEQLCAECNTPTRLQNTPPTLDLTTPTYFSNELSTPVCSNHFNHLSLNVDTRLPVTVVYTKSPNQFCIQLNRYMRQLEELQSTLQQYAKECKERVTDITAGSLYVVLAEDNVWYRGIVMGAPEGSSKSVPAYFVDYGNEESIPVSSILPILPEHTALAFQGIAAKLHGVSEDSEWSSAACEKFDKLVFDQHLYCNVKAIVDGTHVIELYNADTKTLITLTNLA